MSGSTVSGHFVEGTKGPIFVLARTPASGSCGSVLVVPPFAEEMNKCRRMVTEASLGLAVRGVATVVPDLYGTGDSAGDFSDATWETWRGDLARTAEWSAQRGCPVTGILAIRLGCALAADAMAGGALPAVARSVLWQPVFDGARFLTQFLRLRVAANLMDDQRESVSGLRARLKAGEVLEVAGYGLSGQLATELESLVFSDGLPGQLGAIAWLEIAMDAGAPLPAPSRHVIDRTRLGGGHVLAQGVAGEPFWASTEIVVQPAFVAGTVTYLADEPLRTEP